MKTICQWAALFFLTLGWLSLTLRTVHWFPPDEFINAIFILGVGLAVIGGTDNHENKK